MAAGDIEVYTADAASPTDIDNQLTGNSIAAVDNITSHVKSGTVYFVVAEAA